MIVVIKVMLPITDIELLALQHQRAQQESVGIVLHTREQH